jgi:hypothetical protein
MFLRSYEVFVYIATPSIDTTTFIRGTITQESSCSLHNHEPLQEGV